MWLRNCILYECFHTDWSVFSRHTQERKMWLKWKVWTWTKFYGLRDIMSVIFDTKESSSITFDGRKKFFWSGKTNQWENRNFWGISGSKNWYWTNQIYSEMKKTHFYYVRLFNLQKTFVNYKLHVYQQFNPPDNYRST